MLRFALLAFATLTLSDRLPYTRSENAAVVRVENENDDRNSLNDVAFSNSIDGEYEALNNDETIDSEEWPEIHLADGSDEVSLKFHWLLRAKQSRQTNKK